MTEQVDFTSNSFNKMARAQVIRRTDKGMWIQLKNVHDKLREDGTCWNRRDMDAPGTLENIESLIRHLNAGGEVPAIEVQARHGGGVEKVDGYCRTVAYRAVDASGIGELWIRINPFIGDELDALVRIQTSNEGLKLTPTQQLDLFQSIRDELRNMGLKGTLQEVADKVNKTRQYVDQILQLGRLDDESHAMLKSGEISTKQAIAAVRAAKGAEGEHAVQVLREEIKKQVEEKTRSLEPTVSPSLLADMYRLIAPLPASISPKEAADVEAYLRGDREHLRNADYVMVDLAVFAKLCALLSEGSRQLESKQGKALAKKEELDQESIDLE